MFFFFGLFFTEVEEEVIQLLNQCMLFFCKKKRGTTQI